VVQYATRIGDMQGQAGRAARAARLWTVALGRPIAPCGTSSASTSNIRRRGFSGLKLMLNLVLIYQNIDNKQYFQIRNRFRRQNLGYNRNPLYTFG